MPASPSQRLAALPPHATVRVQLVAAASMWLIGSSILLVRGVSYLSDRIWHSWALAIGLALGVIKAHALLDRVAAKAVTRIHTRGTAWFFGFFSVRSWALIAVMMGTGMVLRRVVVQPGVIGAGIMGAIYIGVGTALLIADRHFWRAVVTPPSDTTPESPESAPPSS